MKICSTINNTVAHCPILLNIGGLMHCGSTVAVVWLTTNFGQLNMVDGAHVGNNSATDCPILLKFGRQAEASWAL